MRILLPGPPYLEFLAHLGRGQAGDDCTAAGGELDQAFCLELAHGLAQWCPTDPQLLGQLVLEDALARCERAIDDQLSQARYATSRTVG